MYVRREPDEALRSIVDCYWFVDDDDPTPRRQKIVPDGFPEIILHLGDPYRIRLSGRWETQAMSLIAGQILNHFYLQNTGVSRMVGLKLRPTAPSRLFRLDMSRFTDSVVDLDQVRPCPNLRGAALRATSQEETVRILNRILLEALEHAVPANDHVETAVGMIFASWGTARVAELAEATVVSERHMERLFKKHVGISPKRLARIVRLGRIFDLVRQGNHTWSQLAFETGHYDQAHFIRNFQSFTGEDPSRYGFNDQNLANFFLAGRSESPHHTP